MSTLTTEPGATLDLTLQSKPNSTVYLLAVDRSVKLLKTGNNIDKSKVTNDLNDYNADKNYTSLQLDGTFFNGHEDDDKKRYNDFGESNAFIITNAYEGNVICLKERSSGLNVNGNRPKEIDLVETPNDDLTNFKSKARANFPETWIFEKIKIDSKGMGTLSKTVPDKITSWDITGFSMHENFGLGIAKPQKLTVSQKFFIMINLPYSIRVGEILKVEIQVFNYYSMPYDIDVTLFSQKEIEENEETFKAERDDDDNKIYDGNKCGPNDPCSTTEKPKGDVTFEDQLEFYDGSLSSGSCMYLSSVKGNKDKKRSEKVTVDSNSVKLVHFYIKSVRHGSIQLRARAEISGFKEYFDEVIRKLKVEYEGHTVRRNYQYLINLRNGKKADSHNIDLLLNEKAIKNSLTISTYAIGDLSGPAITNTANLV